MSDFTSDYTGPQIEQKLDDVAALNQRVSDAEGQISGLETSKYEKPAGGIPKSDLASAVQTSLGKADSSLQSSNVKQTTGSSTTDVMSQKATTDALNGKVDKVNGKGLSTNDYTDAEKTKLGALPTNTELQQALGGKADKDPNAVEGNIAKFDANGNPVDGGIPANNVAQKDGYYEKLGAGTAKYIEGETPVTDSFMERTTGGDAEVANGLAQITEVAGKSQRWNQLVKNGNFSNSDNWTGISSIADGVATSQATATGSDITKNIQQTNMPYLAGHKYIFLFFVKSNNAATQVGFFPTSNSTQGSTGYTLYNNWTRVSYLWTCPETFDTRLQIRGYNHLDNTTDIDFSVKNVICIDLTLLGIDNLTTVAEVEAWLAKNIGHKAYYPYNAGEVLNNKMEGLESIGRNLLDPATGKARIIGAYSDVYGNYYGITGTHGAITFTSDLGEVSTITPDSDGKFLLETPGWLDVATPGEDCCIFLWWDGTKTDFVEHKVSKAHIDVTHIWGKKNGTGDLVQVWPSGSPGLPSVKDILRNEGGVAVARKRLVAIDLSTVSTRFQIGGVYNCFYMDLYPETGVAPVTKDKILCANYAASSTPEALVEKGVCGFSNYRRVYIKDSAYTLDATGAASLKASLANNPFYFPLYTEEVYTDLVYQGSDHFADGTPVTLPVSLEIDNWGIERAIPQNDESLVTSAPEVSIQYSVDVAEEMNTIHDSGIFVEDLKANLNAVLAVVNEKLATAMGGTISLGSTPVDKVYPAIFTPTPEPDSNNE